MIWHKTFSVIILVTVGSGLAPEVVAEELTSTQPRLIPAPFEFVQRSDVGREIQLRPVQLELLRRLQPICDAQCQSRVIGMMERAGSEAQTRFLLLSDPQQQAAVAALDQFVREELEMDALEASILSAPQMLRFEQLRNQFMGPAALLTGRVADQLNLDSFQIDLLNEINNIGAGLTNECRANQLLSSARRQTELLNIQNVIIDQSINVLDDAQIQIFQNLCGEKCDFDESANEPAAQSDSEYSAVSSDSQYRLQSDTVSQPDILRNSVGPQSVVDSAEELIGSGRR